MTAGGAGKLGPHPEPPADLEARKPSVVEETIEWWRSHPADKGALFFGKTGNYRFDAPDGSFGVMYMGADLQCAFIETFGEMVRSGLVTMAALKLKRFSLIRASRPLRLVDLDSSGELIRLGADARLFSGDYEVAQRWSAALRGLKSKPDGILYPARHDPKRRACALFDGASGVVTERAWGRLTDKKRKADLERLIRIYRFGV